MDKSKLVQVDDELHEIDGNPLPQLRPDQVELMIKVLKSGGTDFSSLAAPFAASKPTDDATCAPQVIALVKGAPNTPVVLTIRTPPSKECTSAELESD